MGYVGPNVRIIPSARFWSSSLRDSEVSRLADQIIRICEKQPGATCPTSLDLGEVQRSDLELAADAHYVFDLTAPVRPYAGAGLSLHLLNGRGEFINGTFVEDLLDTVVPGFDVIGGFDVPVAPSLKLLTEVRVTLTSDLYGRGVKFHGVVVGVGGGSGSAFALIPAQNATGNWIKVVQRVPVRIALDPKELAKHPLRVGLSMKAAVDVS